MFSFRNDSLCSGGCQRQTAGLTLLLVVVTLALNHSLEAADTDRALLQLQAHLQAGEFGLAAELAEQARTPGERDAWLRRIAAAQARAGMFRSSLATASSIASDDNRSDVFAKLAETPIGLPRRGGAALADFDSLIELIESTISPDSWDAVGGPGAIEEFPGGVYVDAEGLVKRIAVDPAVAVGLEAARKASREAERHRDVRRASPLRKVSLTRLERQLQSLWARGRGPEEAMRNLAGLQRIDYLFFYPESRDIVLAGPAGNWTTDLEGRVVSADNNRPVLQLDDLVVVLRNAFEADGRFGCSITPRQRNLAEVQRYLRESAKRPLEPGQRDDWLNDLRHRLGRQDVDVFGMDPRTRTARILVEADYRMKLVGMGLEPGTRGVTSYLASIRGPDGGTPPPMDVLRWWFTLDRTGLRTTETGDAFALLGRGVQVLGENELLTKRGERVHTGKSNALNSQFTDSFTKHFADLTTKYPIYAELQNVFELAIVAAIIRDKDLHGQIEWKLMHFLDPTRCHVRRGPAPGEIDTVMNHRVIRRRHVVVGVSGGVSVDTSKLVSSLEVDDYGQLRGGRQDARPLHAQQSWWWD